MRTIVLALCVTAVLSVWSLRAEACTSIQIKTTDGHVFYARTMEGEVDFKSAAMTIPKGIEYQGTLPDGSQKGLKWITKYGAVGMNAFDMPFLTDGVNEKGLAAGNLLFPGFAEYQPFDPKDADKTMAQWEVLTWMLTNFATVAEVKEAITNIRVVKGPTDKVGFLALHFVVHDAKGNCAVIEYVKGKLNVYDNPVGVMTNSPGFDWHLLNLRNYVNLSPTNAKPHEIGSITIQGFGQGTGLLGLPGDYTPPSRFVRMVALTSSAAFPVTGSDDGLGLAMTIINNADIAKGAIRDLSGSEPAYDITYWTVVADLDRLRYYFHTYNNKDWLYVDVMKSLEGAKDIKSVKIDMPPEYKDVTSKAK